MIDIDKDIDIYTNYEDYLDIGHLNQLMENGYNEMNLKQKREAAKKMYYQQRCDYMAEIEEAAQAGDWKSVCFYIENMPVIMKEAFDIYYSRIPDSMKYRFVINMYQHHGYAHANIRNALKKLRKYGSPELPDWMKDKDVITIYRGGCENIEKVAKSISWTTDKNVAEFFANRNINFFHKDCHLYEGKIKVDDIIVYTDDRQEKEVMQYNKVYDIITVPIDGMNGIPVSSDNNGTSDIR